MTLLGLFVEHLLPILLVAAAGYAFASITRIDARGIGAVAFQLLAPCLIFQTLVESHVPAAAMGRIVAFTALVMAIPAALAFAIARAARWSRPCTSAVVLCALVPNVGNYGLSANRLAFGPDGLTYASVFYLAASVVAYTVAVMVASLGRTGWRQALVGLIRVPSVWALLAASLVRGFHVAVPEPVRVGVSLLAAACIPCLLVILGTQLRGARLQAAAAPLWVASGLRLLVGMAAGLACAPLLGLEGAARQASVLQSAMPTAVITSVLATEYQVEPGLVSSVVLLTTLLSPLTLTPLLAVLR